MTWKTSIHELIKTLVAGAECECDTRSGRLTIFRFYENQFAYKLGPEWYVTGFFGDVIRWRPARPKVESVVVRESCNGLWSFYTGSARIYVAEKPSRERIQVLDCEKDYGEAEIKYVPCIRVKQDPLRRSICGVPTFQELTELWVAGKKCTPCDAAPIKVKPKVGRINVSVYSDHASITLRSGGTCCKANFIKSPSMADMANMFPDLDFSEAYFIINE